MTRALFIGPALLLAMVSFSSGQQIVSPVPAVAVVASVPAATPAPVLLANVGPDASGKYTLHEGADVNLRFAQDLSSRTAAEGDPVVLTLVDDLKVGEVVVAKAGSKAFGEVTNAKKSGFMGKAGELNLRLEYLKVGDTKIKLRGARGREGESGTTSAVVLTVLFGPIGLIKHGHNVDIKEGAALHGFVGDDVSLVPAT